MQIHVRCHAQLKPFIRASVKRPHANLMLIDLEPNPMTLGLKVAKLEKLPEASMVAFYVTFNDPKIEARIELTPEDPSEEVFLYGPYFHRNEPEKTPYDGVSLLITSESMWLGNSDIRFL